MALIVLDPCQLGFKPQSDGGIIQIANIEGFPEGISLMLPLTEESCAQLHKKLSEKLGSTVKVATPIDVTKEVRRAGLAE